MPMAKKRRPGKRTKSGRLSRAYRDPDVRDQGTHQVQAKRQAIVGESNDPNLSASAPGILHAHGYLDKHQYAEALEYRRLRCVLYGTPWPSYAESSIPSDSLIESMQESFDEKVRMLNEDQRHVVTNVAVFDAIPNWFFARRLNLKILPEDVAEEKALTSGLDALLGRSESRRVFNKPIAPKELGHLIAA